MLPASNPNSSTKFGSWVSSYSSKLHDTNRRIAAWAETVSKLPVTASWLLNAEVLTAYGVGWTMLQLNEFVIAILLFLIATGLLIAKSAAWAMGKREPVVVPFLKWSGVLASVLFGVFWIFVSLTIKGDKAWSNLQDLFFPPKVAVNVESRITARVHLRAKWLSGGSTEVYAPVFQDLFNDWTIKVVPNRHVSVITLTVKDARQPTSTIRVEPEGIAEVSDPKPQWTSGFTERTQTPDFYLRTITIREFGAPVSITIRKPIKSHDGVNEIKNLDLDMDRVISAASRNCEIDLHTLPVLGSKESNYKFNKLVANIRTLVNQHVTNGPAPTRLDPEAPYPQMKVNESEMVSELKCADDDCARLIVAMSEKTRIQ